MSQSTYGEPQRKKRNALGHNRYPITHNEPFLFVHMPSRWMFAEVEGEYLWLPEISQQPLTRGVNGIVGEGPNEEDRNASVYVAQFERKGGTVIRENDQRLAEEYQNYVRVVPCIERDGRVGEYHCTQFQKLYVNSGRTIPKTDDTAYRKFLLHLMEQGIVGPMSEVVLEKKIDVQEERVRSQRRRAGRNPHLEEEMEEAKAILAQMRPAWEKQFGAKPEPQPKGKK